MKKLTSLMLAGLFCFVGLNLTGCGGNTENTVVESSGTGTDEVLQTQDMMDQYAAEMAAASNPAAQQQAAPAPAEAEAEAEAPAE